MPQRRLRKHQCANKFVGKEDLEDMKRIAAVLALILVFGTLTSRAADQGLTYVHGTVKALQENTGGTFDTSSQAALELRFGTGQVSIPYAQIKSCSYREENRFRLGVLATIAVGLVKARIKNHFVTITWNDGEGVQVVTLEAPRQRAIGLMEVIRGRAPQACTPRPGGGATCYLPG